jgi:N-acetylglucosaminyldiphosphoundecaprenol N-acetyl-beta-D-mannosaminyltransferase
VPRIRLGPLALDTYTLRAFVAEIVAHALHGTRTRQVVTANAQFFVLADKDTRFRQCVEQAEYICADGMPLVWACNRLTTARIERINGTNLIEDICREGAAHGLRIFLFGGKPGTAEATGALLAARYPGIVVAGHSCPAFGFERSGETLAPVLHAVAAARPHVVFVSLGAPKQELFIRDYLKPLGVPLAVGIGGSFELLSGQIRRAPVWMQNTGLEWAFRLAQEPRRLWKRYLVGNTEFLLRLAKWKLTGSHTEQTLSTTTAQP